MGTRSLGNALRPVNWTLRLREYREERAIVPKGKKEGRGQRTIMER